MYFIKGLRAFEKAVQNFYTEKEVD